MKEDKIEIEVMPDGLIKVTTEKVSAANHMGAEKMLDFLARLMGGETTITRRTKSVHTHAHSHEETKA